MVAMRRGLQGQPQRGEDARFGQPLEQRRPRCADEQASQRQDEERQADPGRDEEPDRDASADLAQRRRGCAVASSVLPLAVIGSGMPGIRPAVSTALPLSD